MEKHNGGDLELSLLWLNERALKHDLWTAWCSYKKKRTYTNAEDIEIVEWNTSKIPNKEIQRKSAFYNSLEINLLVPGIYIKLPYT